MINTLINETLICLDLHATRKEQVFSEMAELLFRAGNITDKAQFIADVQAREAIANTGFEDGIAIPHAKSAAVKHPAVAIGISRQGIDYGAEDGQPSRLFFMIASPEQGADHHIEVLAAFSGKFIEDGFSERLLAADSPAAVMALLTAPTQTSASTVTATKGLLIGVTGCPTGIAHTYLAAEALEQGARELGYQIIVETNGSIGVRNSPTAQQIAEADAILVCSDKQVEMARFAGKRLIQTPVKAPIKAAQQVIRQGLEAPLYQADKSSGSSSAAAQPSGRSDIYRFLMNGVSHMIPFVVTGGLMIALSLAIGGQPGPSGMSIPEGSIWQSVLDVGVVAFKLMIPILSAYIAYAIGDRSALAPGFIGGWIANTGSFYGAEAGTGFIGAILAGLIVGYVVRWLATRRYPKMVQPLVPILIVPLTGTLFIAGLFIFVIGAPISSAMTGMNHLLVSLNGSSLVLLGIVIGGMAGFDMGGPVNKVAFLFCLSMLTAGHAEYMGAITCAIPVAPLGMGLATFLSRKLSLFAGEENEAGKASFAMGLVGISEGAIPFAARDPLSVIPANVIGSMAAAVMAFQLGITNQVAHGGPIVVLLGAMNKPSLALLTMFTGALLTAVIAIAVKYMRVKAAQNKRAVTTASMQKSATH
ncbi:PTS fructose transporter subunit IIABC [Erwinia rhapontici]|uniref:PTS fructose transporter subunit IIABC n=1 Tax=Erwinia rhapontici TaxID=55212 RepID=UPI0013312185|nr:fructose-specific PTS transporter subunit EIIC [Erwinia rhapontici]MBP2155965.1 PTS system fructose-specific IIC component [Erwinia rhapontici]